MFRLQAHWHCQCGASNWTCSCKLQRQLERQLPADSLLAQHRLQAWDHVRCSSAGHPSPVRWLQLGRRRQSSLPVAPPTSTSCDVISEKFDIVALWYQKVLISETVFTPYHRQNSMKRTIDIRNSWYHSFFHDLCYEIICTIHDSQCKRLEKCFFVILIMFFCDIDHKKMWSHIGYYGFLWYHSSARMA